MINDKKIKRINTFRDKKSNHLCSELAKAVLSPNYNFRISKAITTYRDTTTPEENEIIIRLKEKAYQRINNRPKDIIVVDKTWLLDDSELSYIPVPKKNDTSAYITRIKLT